MAQISFSVRNLVARLVKVAMVAVILPLAVGLLLGVLDELRTISNPATPLYEWISTGFLVYVGVHVLIYRPVGLFRASRRLFSALSVWLFGGQVTSVEEADSGKGKRSNKAKGNTEDAAAQGSTLVAFSPYAVPLYTVLVCAAGGLSHRWWDQTLTDGTISILIGFTMAFHWLMTADELQQNRSRWHIETYFLALGLVFVLTVLIAAACLPWAIPEFSFLQALSEGLARTKAVYAIIWQRLFW